MPHTINVRDGDCMIFNTEEDVTNWVRKNYSEKELQRLDIHSNAPIGLVLYKGNAFEKINTFLRENPECMELPKEIDALQKLICEYFIPTDIIVYRYVSYKENLWLNRMTQWRKVCKYQGFLSTTLLKKRYRELHDEVHRKSVIEIKVPKGTIGTYLPEVNPNMPEFEILFPHETRLKRTGIDKYTIVIE